eukprot:CAMPEP_0179137194 /NCGR_PEP_ID=MMETSP0796-20121207/65437_1 /TAXON_ID=73915 /ORGANISM="Pyrodinium bahamense, Strain pbaha01" /LENGTH=267 /DNA_ID=CAMNT_0020836363 /DNA_START=93 /DNA_END=897 /DNA_ORIENTATION=+
MPRELVRRALVLPSAFKAPPLSVPGHHIGSHAHQSMLAIHAVWCQAVCRRLSDIRLPDALAVPARLAALRVGAQRRARRVPAGALRTRSRGSAAGMLPPGRPVKAIRLAGALPHRPPAAPLAPPRGGGVPHGADDDRAQREHDRQPRRALSRATLGGSCTIFCKRCRPSTGTEVPADEDPSHCPDQVQGPQPLVQKEARKQHLELDVTNMMTVYAAREKVHMAVLQAKVHAWAKSIKHQHVCRSRSDGTKDAATVAQKVEPAAACHQ